MLRVLMNEVIKITRVPGLLKELFLVRMARGRTMLRGVSHQCMVRVSRRGGPAFLFRRLQPLL